METLFLCGAGNSEGVRLALRVARAGPGRWDRLLILDDDPRRLDDRLCDVPVVGPISMLADMERSTCEAANLVARTTAGRAAVAKRIAGYGVPLAQLVHPGVDTEWASLEDDVTVYEYAVVSPETTVGAGSVVFMRAVVGHEAQVGRGCVLAAGSVLNARVVLGDGVYVGSNASILPEVRVGEGATIGANSLVVGDVPAGATVVGVPGQIIGAGIGAAAARTAAPGVPCAASPEVERALAGIWSTVLGHEVRATDVPFFDVGGTSLLALRMLQAIRDKLGHELTVIDLYRFPTIRGLAECIGASGNLPADEGGTGWQRGVLRRARVQRSHSSG